MCLHPKAFGGRIWRVWAPGRPKVDDDSTICCDFAGAAVGGGPDERARPGAILFVAAQPMIPATAVAVEQLPPPGPNIDENGDYVPAPPRASQVPPVVSRGPQWLPGYRDPNEPKLSAPGFAVPATQPAATNTDPDAIRPPQPIGARRKRRRSRRRLPAPRRCRRKISRRPASRKNCRPISSGNWSTSPPRSRPAPSSSIRRIPTSIWCSAAARRCATACASAAKASPGPAPSASPR